MGENGVLVFPDAATGRAASSIDPNLLLALQNGGGFGGNGSWIWILFLWMMWQNGGFNNFRNNGGTFAELSSQMSNSEGRQYLAEIMNGRFDNLNTLAQIVNSGVETVKTGIFTLQSSIQSVGAQVGMSALETQNAIALGNANLSRQVCECCCENRLAIANQTNAIQAQAAANHSAATLQAANDFAATRLQLAQNEAADQLSVCQQTNQLGSQAERNYNGVLNAIAQQSIMINDKFCELEKRELQNKINTQGDIITQLRGQLDNDRQTAQLYAIINPIKEQLNNVASKQPNTVPVQYPNLVAANATPFIGQGYSYGNGFGPGIVL